jgi:hypothetical protein
MSDSEIPNESSADSEEDTDFVMRKCGVCQERNIGKSMYPCAKCGLPICQGCGDDNVYIGCTLEDEEDSICTKCFQTFYNGKPRYCRAKGCECDNPSPKKKKKLEAQEEVQARIDSAFWESFNIDKWKEEHNPIDYPSKHKGKYLIDLFLSDDSFEHGYLSWLVDKATERLPGQSDDAYEHFQLYRKEAADILNMHKNTKPEQTHYKLRKRDKSPKRVCPKQ